MVGSGTLLPAGVESLNFAPKDRFLTDKNSGKNEAYSNFFLF